MTTQELEEWIARIERAIVKLGLKQCERCGEYKDYIKKIYLRNIMNKKARIPKNVCINCENIYAMEGEL